MRKILVVLILISCVLSSCSLGSYTQKKMVEYYSTLFDIPLRLEQIVLNDTVVHDNILIFELSKEENQEILSIVEGSEKWYKAPMGDNQIRILFGDKERESGLGKLDLRIPYSDQMYYSTYHISLEKFMETGYSSENFIYIQYDSEQQKVYIHEYYSN